MGGATGRLAEVGGRELKPLWEELEPTTLVVDVLDTTLDPGLAKR